MVHRVQVEHQEHLVQVVLMGQVEHQEHLEPLELLGQVELLVEKVVDYLL